MSIDDPLCDKVTIGGAKEMAAIKKGAFLPFMRVACPIKNFARRLTHHCVDCDYFFGLQAKRIRPEPKLDDKKMMPRKYNIICGHPIGRSIEHYPED